MSDHQHAACMALAAADVGAVEVLGASSDSTAPSFNTVQHKEKAMTATNVILEDRILLDQIERLEWVLELLAEEANVSGYFQILAQNALHEAIEHFIELREKRAR